MYWVGSLSSLSTVIIISSIRRLEVMVYVRFVHILLTFCVFCKEFSLGLLWWTEENLLCTVNGTVWYTLSPVGINQIDHFMRTMTKLAGLETTQKNFMNHSVQKTLVRKLQKSGISNDKIASITGHSSEQSLRDYADTDIADHAKMSKILSSHSHPPQPPQQKQHVRKCHCPS